jgi:hypothetical protein
MTKRVSAFVFTRSHSLWESVHPPAYCGVALVLTRRNGPCGERRMHGVYRVLFRVRGGWGAAFGVM